MNSTLFVRARLQRALLAKGAITQTRRLPLLVPLVLLGEHVALAVLYAASYSVGAFSLATIGLAAYCIVVIRATHHDIESLACITMGIGVLLTIGLISTPVINPDWNGDRLDWIQSYSLWIVFGALLGALASRWAWYRKSVSSRLNALLADRHRTLFWGGYTTVIFLITTSTFTFDVASRLMNDSYGVVFEWIPEEASFQIQSILAAILTLPITIPMVTGLPVIVILFVGVETTCDAPANKT